MSAYDEARKSGQKYSAAVREAVEFIKRQYPDMPISVTEVKRVLAHWRPKGSGTILSFEPKILSNEEIERLQSMWNQMHEPPGRSTRQRQCRITALGALVPHGYV